MTTAKNVLIVDDDHTLCESLLEQFSLQGDFAASAVATAADAIKSVQSNPIDLLILDVGLPDLDGREACRIMRAKGYKGPVIMLTGEAASDTDTILGLDAGASDYVAKPFKFAVLLARVRAHLRQHEQSEDAVFRIGRFTFRPSAKLLTDDNHRKVRLTEKEAAILKYLYRAGQRVVARDLLLREVWGYRAGVSTHTLETHVYRLRQKIERDPSRAEILVTEEGGYKLIP